MVIQYVLHLLFYLNVEWNLLTTKDFITFEEDGVSIKKGNIDEQDLYIFTGSVLEANGMFYIYYTGHNPHFIEAGKNQEVILRASSKDLINWKKDESFSLKSNEEYDKHDFRDPFVFYDENINKYRMILAARKNKGDFYRRGRLISYTSFDLDNWELDNEEFYAPDAFFMHECPDYFKMGDWYYLLFSEFNDKFCTHYRMSKTPYGPWIAPEKDTFDNRSFYAAKTTANEKRERYLFGWNPTRIDNRDYSPWQWGGTLVVHQIVQR